MIGLDCITGLQTARLLAERGVPVVAVAGDGDHFACRSRAPDAVVVGDAKGPGLIDLLVDVAGRLRHRPVLVPCTDEAVLQIARQRSRLDPLAHVVQPAPEVVELLLDKVSFARHAEAHGLPVPTTRVVTDRSGVVAAGRELTFPCIAKPPGSRPTGTGPPVRRWCASTPPRSCSPCTTAWQRWPPLSWCRSGSRAPTRRSIVNGYFRHGEPVATFVARKLRQWPPRSGTSCLGEEVRDDEVLAATVALFRSVGFHGLGYVELKRDARTGRALIIEPNVGRPTGRSAIAEAGGVDLLLAMHRDTLGLPLPPGLEQTYGGVKWVHIARDVPSAWYYLRRGELTPVQWWRSLQGLKTDAVFSRHDPAPFVAQLKRDVAAGVRGLRRRVIARRRAG